VTMGRGRPRRLALAALLLAASCSRPIVAKAELRADVIPRGEKVTEMEIRTAAGVVDLALREMGFERREVVPMADGRLRIVLPESAAGRMPEVRKRLEDPRLGIRLN
jgi:hypothetical protein